MAEIMFHFPFFFTYGNAIKTERYGIPACEFLLVSVFETKKKLLLGVEKAAKMKQHPKVNKTQIKLSKLSSARRLFENLGTKELKKIYIAAFAEEQEQNKQSADGKKAPTGEVMNNRVIFK